MSKAEESDKEDKGPQRWLTKEQRVSHMNDHMYIHFGFKVAPQSMTSNSMDSSKITMLTRETNGFKGRF